MTQTISIPPAVGVTIKPAGGEFAFYVTATTNVCFGTADPAGSFPDLEDQTFEWATGSTHTFPIPADVGAELPYNTSSPGTVCSAVDPTDTGKVIVVGSSMRPKTKSKPKPKKTAVKKAASKKSGSKTAAKRKAAPKKAAKKSKAKAKPKSKAKPKAKKKSAKKSRR